MPSRWAVAVLAALILAASPPTHAPAAAQQDGAAPEGSGPYPDTPSDAWYGEPVARLAEQGLFEGTLCDGGFCPDGAMDRKTMAVWVVRMLDGRDPAPTAESRFDDVDPASFHAPFIERMFGLKVTAGCGDGSGFCPDRTVTRAQMAVFLSRAYRLPEGLRSGFSDVAVDAWYAGDVAKLVASGVTRGCGDGSRFCPDQDTTRAQMATFLWRAKGLASDDADCSFTKSAPAAAASVFQVITGSGIAGTAFYIGNGEFMTAAHVVPGVGTGQLTLRNRANNLTARIVGADFEADIAVLSAPGEGLAPLRFGTINGIGLGHPLGVIGYPVYETPSASLVTGVLSRTEDDDTLGTLVQTDAAINPGNSGGPVIDKCGRVLGMAVSKLVGEGIEGISYAISADTLKARLQRARDAGTSAPPSDAAPGGDPGSAWYVWSSTTSAGRYIGASASGSTSRLQVSLNLTCYPDNESLGLDVNFQTAGGSFDVVAGGVSVEYQFGSQSAPVSQTWTLHADNNPGGTDVVNANKAQRTEFAKALRADDSDTLRVDLDDSISVRIDLTGAEQSAYPVLEACGA